MDNPNPSQDRVEELKPCPFCGGSDVLIDKTSPLSRLFAVYCELCEISGEKAIDAAGAVSNWNTRPESESVTVKPGSYFEEVCEWRTSLAKLSHGSVGHD